jgi:hypothetical protein
MRKKLDRMQIFAGCVTLQYYALNAMSYIYANDFETSLRMTQEPSGILFKLSKDKIINATRLCFKENKRFMG